MRSLRDVENYWGDFSKYDNLPQLRTALWDDEQVPEFISELRSVCWKAVLLFRDVDHTTWPTALSSSRSAYDSLRTHFLRAVENPDELDSNIDPLAEDTESPWTALRKDETIRAEIFQDVERCMPENTYFRQPPTQKMLLDILFVWCKLNPDLGYRQGMHELLAPIVWVVERDAVARLTAEDVEKGEPGVLASLLDGRYIEHDAFTLFGAVMQTSKSFYDPSSQPKGLEVREKQRREAFGNESPMILRSRRIFDDLLPNVDPDLSGHLQDLEIMPQIFLMRWVRLLFGREFSFDDLLRVWDMLFADGPNLDLVDYVCVAMLLRIRWQLLEADTNEALTLLLRYPRPSPPHHATSFVFDAQYINNNLNFEAGSNIILKYTGRQPTSPRRRLERPSTPQGSLSNTPRSNRSRSPFNSQPPVSFESLLQDAARGVMSRSERWGLNQAVRDAVVEVRRNVQVLQPSGRSSPRKGTADHGSSKRNSRSEAPSTIAANVLRKINALEDRNKQLAKMLEDAVAELWKYQKQESEKEHKQDNEKSLHELSVAVAKVQFVQAFLQDLSLPLPVVEDHPPPEISDENQEPINNSEEAHAQSSTAIIPKIVEATDSTEAPIGGKSTQEVDNPFLDPAIGNSSSSANLEPKQPSSQASSRRPSTQSQLVPAISSSPPKSTARSRLAGSSLSWMLGEGKDVTEAFPASSPFTPNEKRYHAAHGGLEKGFLFGDDDDDIGQSPGKRKGSRNRDKGKAGSNTPTGEEIGLGELGDGRH